MVHWSRVFARPLFCPVCLKRDLPFKVLNCLSFYADPHVCAGQTQLIRGRKVVNESGYGGRQNRVQRFRALFDITRKEFCCPEISSQSY